MNMNRGQYCRYTAPCLLSLLNWFYNSFYTTVIENNIIANELFKLNIIPYKPNYSVTIAYSLQKFCIKWCADYAAGDVDNITNIEIS